jgi:glycosyltransferase involved in cell wall biosynthesis
LGRILAFLRFVRKANKKALSIPDVDLVYASSTPLTIGLTALKLKKKKDIPYYFEVRDLWPEAPVQMGVIRNSILKKYLYGLEKKIYQHAQKIIALSPGMRDGIEKIAPEKPIYILPNISDCDFFYPETKDQKLEEKYKVKDKFVISYFGAIGKVNKLDFMVELMRACQEKALHQIHFFIAGKGAETEKINLLIQKYGLRNVTTLGFLNKEGIKELLNVTDATYISFADKPILETNSPNKFFDAIAAGKLCIVNTQGWIKEMIELKECGFYANPYDPNDFIEKLIPFLKERSKLLLYQANARKLAENYFSRDLQTEKFIRLFSKEEKLEPISPSVYTLTA